MGDIWHGIVVRRRCRMRRQLQSGLCVAGRGARGLARDFVRLVLHLLLPGSLCLSCSWTAAQPAPPLRRSRLVVCFCASATAAVPSLPPSFRFASLCPLVTVATMVQVLCDAAGLGFVAMFQLLVPSASFSSKASGPSSRPLRSSSFVQPSRILASAASLACCAVDVLSCGAPVQDVTAAPPVRRDCYKLAPRTLALKTRKARKRGSSSAGRSDGAGDDDGGDYSDGNCGGDGSWGGGENGRGGWDSWGESWNDESHRWDEGRDALALLYQAACWLSLSKCAHYVVVKAVGWGRDGGSASVDEAPFARCTSVFFHQEAVGMPVVHRVIC